MSFKTCPNCLTPNSTDSSACERCRTGFLVELDPEYSIEDENGDLHAASPGADQLASSSTGFIHFTELLLAGRAGSQPEHSEFKELVAYFRGHLKVFEGFPDMPERADYHDGLARLKDGLEGLLSLAVEARDLGNDWQTEDWHEAMTAAAECDRQLFTGKQLLDAALREALAVASR